MFDDKYFADRSRAEWNARVGGPREYGSAGLNDGWATGNRAREAAQRTPAAASPRPIYAPAVAPSARSVTPPRAPIRTANPSVARPRLSSLPPRQPTSPSPSRWQPTSPSPSRWQPTTPSPYRAGAGLRARRVGSTERTWAFVTAPFRWCWAVVLFCARACVRLLTLVVVVATAAILIAAFRDREKPLPAPLPPPVSVVSPASVASRNVVPFGPHRAKPTRLAARGARARQL